MSRLAFYFLAICRILCYSISGATSTPVGGSPSILIGGDTLLFTPNRKKGGAHMVTWEGLFAFCMVIIAVISLVRQDNDNKKK